jgi:hypothetical protein
MLVAAALLVLGGPLALQACATPEPVAYGPISETVRYGYKDHANPDGGHTVLVVMPAWSTLAEARAHWDRRAEELCPGGVSKRNIFRAERKEIMMHATYSQYTASVGSRATTGYELEGYVYCKAATPGPS